MKALKINDSYQCNLSMQTLKRAYIDISKAPSTRIRRFLYPQIFSCGYKISASTRSVYESYTTVHTYPIRIRTSQRISQQSMRIKTGSDTVTSAYTKIYGYERPHVSGYTAYTEISTLESVYRNLRIHRAYTADTCGRQVYPHKKICGYKNLRIRVGGA